MITWIDGSDSSVCYVAYLIIYKVFYPAGYFFLYRTPIAIWRTSILGFWNGGMWTMAAGRFRSQVSRGFLNRREFSSEIFVSSKSSSFSPTAFYVDISSGIWDLFVVISDQL